MTRTATSFSRGKTKLKVQPTVLVICEDKLSSVRYLQDASGYFRSFALIDVCHCGKTDPLGILNEAVARCSNFDFVYCVIDRDTHANFDEAVTLAASHRNKIQLIVSYPSYEFWLLLHFEKARRPYVRAGKNSAGDLVVRDLKTKDGMRDYDKGRSEGLFDKLIDRLPNARTRSAQVLKEAELDGAKNPSTEIHLLIRIFEKLGEPEKLKPKET